MTLVAGVDSSTQSTKIVVCQAETGEIVRQARAPHPDGTSACADRWWEAYQQASEGGLLDGVEAIAVGGQQHGMVTLDERDALVRDALLWNDTRSADSAADLVQELGGERAWIDAVGLIPGAAITGAKVRWLRDHEPDHLARTHTVVLPHDWMTGRILQQGNGFQGWTTDRGDASGTGYWSPATGDYRRDLLTLAAGRDLEVPRVLAPAEAAGRTESGMLVAAGTGDNMAAALGLGLAAGDAVVSLGTSGTAFALHDSPVRDESGNIMGFASADGRFLPLMCTLNAARVMGAAAALLDVDLHELDGLALSAEPGAGGLTLLPYLDGERTPSLPTATGTLGGLTRANATPANLARAAVEGMLCNMVAGVDGLRAQGIPVERIFIIGGAGASQAVRQVAPMLFGAPVVIPQPAEYVALGAARQAAWALSGSEQPPAWEVATDTVLDPPAQDTGAPVRERYAALLRTTHGIG